MWKAISILLAEETFYGHIINQLCRIETKQIPTLGVTAYQGRLLLLWNPDFFNSLKKFDHKKGVLKHEILHIILKHIYRDDLSDKKIANVAMDLVINQMVGRENLPSDNEHYGQYIEDYQKKYGRDMFPDDATTNYYYKTLKKLQDEGKEDFTEGYDHHWKVSDGEDPEKMSNRSLSDAERQVIDAACDQMVKSAKQADPRSWGNLPGNVKSLLEQMMEKKKPQLPWKVILKRFVAKTMNSNTRFTMKRFSKRFGTRPGLKKEKQLHLLLAIDSSGSVSDEEFIKFFKEIDGIARSNAMVTVVECDAGVNNSYPYKPGQPISRTGYGGTSFDPVFRWINENKMSRRIDGVLYLTDGYASPPSIKVNVPTLFVISSHGSKVSGYKNLVLPN